MTIFTMINIVAASFGISSYLVTLLTYRIRRLRILKDYAILHTIILFRQLLFTLIMHPWTSQKLILFLNICHILLLTLILYFGFLFLKTLKGSPGRYFQIRLLLIIAFINTGMFTAAELFHINDWLYSGFYYLLITVVILWTLLKGNKTLTKTAKPGLIAILIILPFLGLSEILGNAVSINLFYGPQFFFLAVSAASVIILFRLYLIPSKNRHMPDNSELKKKLSKREWEIASLLYSGLTYQQVADQLFVSLSTVKTHVFHIYKKLNIRNKMELAERIRSIEK